MAKLIIEPQTTGTFSILVTNKSTGAPITSATVVATIYDPTGTAVASNQSMPHTTNGYYDLTINPSWSVSGGSPVEGEFMVDVLVTNAGVQRNKRYYYLTSFGEKSWDV